MSDLSKRCSQKTCEDSGKCTCFAEFSAGPSPSDSPVGPTTDLFGVAVPLAPPSASPARKRSVHVAKARILCGVLDELASQYAQTASTHGLPMPATYGRKPGGLSRSADLTRSLANKLRALPVSEIGSPLYRHRWKSSVTLLGLPICRLRASGHRTSDSDFSGWPTPNAISEKRGGLQINLEAALRRKVQGHQVNLDDAVLMAGWPTPNVPNGGRTISHAKMKGGTAYHEGKKVQIGLEAVAGWAIPVARDGKSELATEEFNEKRDAHPRGKPLSYQAHGVMSNGSPASTEQRGRGVLNPAFSCWLMGFGIEWLMCG